MLNKTETPRSLEKIIFNGGRPVEFKVKSGESASVFAYRVYPELTGLWTKYCKPNENEFFELHERAKILLAPRLIIDEQYKIFSTLFDGFTPAQSSKLVKYILDEDLVGEVVKTVKGPLASYMSYKEATDKLYQAFKEKIYNEVGKPLSKEKHDNIFTKESADNLCSLITKRGKEYLERKGGTVPAKMVE